MMKLIVLVCLFGLALSAPARRDDGSDSNSTLNRPLSEDSFASMDDDQFYQLAVILSEQADGSGSSDQCVTNNEGLEFIRFALGDDAVAEIMANASDADLNALTDCMSPADAQELLDFLDALVALGQVLDGDINTDFGNWTDNEFLVFLAALSNQASGSDVSNDTCVTNQDVEAFFEYLFFGLMDASDSVGEDDNSDADNDATTGSDYIGDDSQDPEDYPGPDACLSAQDAQDALNIIDLMMSLGQGISDDVPAIAQESRRKRSLAY